MLLVGDMVGAKPISNMQIIIITEASQTYISTFILILNNTWQEEMASWALHQGRHHPRPIHCPLHSHHDRWRHKSIQETNPHTPQDTLQPSSSLTTINKWQILLGFSAILRPSWWWHSKMLHVKRLTVTVPKQWSMITRFLSDMSCH